MAALSAQKCNVSTLYIGGLPAPGPCIAWVVAFTINKGDYNSLLAFRRPSYDRDYHTNQSEHIFVPLHDICAIVW